SLTRRSSATAGHITWLGQPMQFKKRKFVPIAPLKNDLIVDDMEKTAAPQAQRIPPLQNRPFTVLKQVLNDADHFCFGEPVHNHCPDRLPPFHWALRHLMVHRPLAVKLRK